MIVYMIIQILMLSQQINKIGRYCQPRHFNKKIMIDHKSIKHNLCT